MNGFWPDRIDHTASPMEGAEVKEVRLIYTQNERRGFGASQADPVRRIQQLWTPSGRLVAEYDLYDPEETDRG